MNIMIVGGKGKMGEFFSRFFKKNGHTVFILDKEYTEEDLKNVSLSDIILLSVPMNIVSEVARDMISYISPGSLLCDISSLKSDICTTYEDLYKIYILEGIEFAGFHPMFGPVNNYNGQKIIYCPINAGPKCKFLIDLLNKSGFEINICTPEEHDKMMATVQVLVHFSKLVTGETLRMLGVSIEDTFKFLSPIYTIELSLIGRLFSQSPELYANIEMMNPYTTIVMDKFIYAAKYFAHLIENKNKEDFCVEFSKISDHLSGFCDDSLKVTNGLIESISTRFNEVLKK